MKTYQDGLAALGDPTRRAIFELLAEGPTPVGELAALLPVSRPAVWTVQAGSSAEAEAAGAAEARAEAACSRRARKAASAARASPDPIRSST